MYGGTRKLVACLSPAALGGCGDSDATTATQTSRQVTVSRRADRAVETGPLKVVGGGSRSYRIAGHHPEVPGFGEEASRSKLREASAAEHGYFVAPVEKDWPAACSYVSKDLVKRLSSGSKQLAGKSCTTILAALTKPGPGGSDYESSEVEAESLRVEKARGFLLYRAATAPYFMPMVNEGGTWKVTNLSPTPFYG